MRVPLSLIISILFLATMNSKKQIKQPVFAEVNLTGDEYKLKKIHNKNEENVNFIVYK